MTPYQRFVTRWHDCTACELHQTRSRLVLARGCVPADVVIVGEGPGKSEDSLGLPFKGAAGKRLDEIIEAAMPPFRLCPDCRRLLRSSPERKICANSHTLALDEIGLPVRIAITNLVCCLPWDTDTNAKMEHLPDEAVERCSVRLVEFMEIADPRLIIAAGREPYDWLEPGYKHSIKFHKPIPVVKIDHPSYIIRQNYAQQNLLTKKAVVAVSQAIDKYI